MHLDDLLGGLELRAHRRRGIAGTAAVAVRSERDDHHPHIGGAAQARKLGDAKPCLPPGFDMSEDQATSRMIQVHGHRVDRRVLECE